MTGKNGQARRSKNRGAPRWDVGLRSAQAAYECPECTSEMGCGGEESNQDYCDGCGRPKLTDSDAWTFTAMLDSLWGGQPMVDRRMES